MAKTSIYLPDVLAEEVRRRDLPVSAICQRALREEVGRLRAADLSGMETLTVYTGDPLAPVKFTGRWLINPQAERVRVPGDFFYYGVAITGRGRIGVWTCSDDIETPHFFEDYDNLSQAAGDGVPAEVIGRAAEALGQDPVVWRDI